MKQISREFIFRPIQTDDTERMLRFANRLSAENTFVQLSGEVLTIEEEKKYILTSVANLHAKKSYHLVVLYQDNIIANGRIDAFSYRKSHVGELHLGVDRDFRGKGLGEALLRTLLRNARDELTLRLVQLNCFENNTAALSLYEKIGFKRVGKLPGALYRNDAYWDEVLMYLPLHDFHEEAI